MMYCTLADIQGQLRDDVIISLTDDEGTGEINMNNVDAAIGNAGNEINGYVQMQYPLPLSPVPPIVKTLATNMAIYNLFSRRGFDESTADKVIVDRYKNAIRFLEKLASGQVKLGTDAPKPNSTVQFQTGDRKFSRESMKGF